ncbi:MAG: metal-dependent transcriptional regulator [Candidatus Zixiibacteriota bacterium]
MPLSENLSASLEDYLEVIFHLEEDNQAARSRDISRRLKVNVSSVTGALQALSQKELVNYSPYEVVTLTEKGKRVARDVVRRHRALRDFFVKVLAIEEKVADAGACKMEHAIPRLILERFIDFVEFVETGPEQGARCVQAFKNFCCQEDRNTDRAGRVSSDGNPTQ